MMNWLWNLAVLLLVTMTYNMLGFSGGWALVLAAVWLMLSTD